MHALGSDGVVTGVVMGWWWKLTVSGRWQKVRESDRDRDMAVGNDGWLWGSDLSFPFFNKINILYKSCLFFVFWYGLYDWKALGRQRLGTSCIQESDTFWGGDKKVTNSDKKEWVVIRRWQGSNGAVTDVRLGFIGGFWQVWSHVKREEKSHSKHKWVPHIPKSSTHIFIELTFKLDKSWRQPWNIHDYKSLHWPIKIKYIPAVRVMS